MVTDYGPHTKDGVSTAEDSQRRRDLSRANGYCPACHRARVTGRYTYCLCCRRQSAERNRRYRGKGRSVME